MLFVKDMEEGSVALWRNGGSYSAFVHIPKSSIAALIALEKGVTRASAMN
jgi:hypothetical protein